MSRDAEMDGVAVVMVDDVDDADEGVVVLVDSLNTFSFLLLVSSADCVTVRGAVAAGKTVTSFLRYIHIAIKRDIGTKMSNM